MNDYFKMLQPLADMYSGSDSIADITIRLAEKAGYCRKPYVFKNGKERERTVYSGKFDDILTAKWICSYKGLFYSILHRHPELSEHHTSIINDTFQIVMQSINIDKIHSDSCIHRYVRMAIAHRISLVLKMIGSPKRLNEYDTTGNRKFTFKTVLNFNSLSLEVLDDNNLDLSYNEMEMNPFILDLRQKIGDSKYGARLLDTVLYSKKKVQLSHIDDFVLIDDGDFTEETKIDILNAYNIIRLALAEYVGTDRYRCGKMKSIHYSFEK